MIDAQFVREIPRSLDSQVRARLATWPERPPGLVPTPRRSGAWLRGRPGDVKGLKHPYLKVPGSRLHRTLPDGLWLNFGGTPVEAFVDIFAVEACGTLQNLLDKRSRFAPNTGSLMAVCPLAWLLTTPLKGDATPRWQLTGVMTAAPVQDLVLPVRDLRVLYGLKDRQYQGFSRNAVPQAYEYFVPMGALTAVNGDQNPAMQALVSRATAAANFFD